MATKQMEKAPQNAQQIQTQQQRFARPRYDVVSSDDGYDIRIFAPGASKESVNVTHEKGSLLITAHRAPHYEDSWKALAREIPDADYRLQLQLNADVDENGINAKLENGVLTVHLPVAEKARPRKISIE